MRLAAAIVLCSLAPAAAVAQHHGDTFGAPPTDVSPCLDHTPAEAEPSLRKVDFPVTTEKEEARGFFNQGMTLLYAFNHQDAMRAFRSATAKDDKLAMAHWGIALAAGPNINVAMDLECQKLAHSEVESAWDLAGKYPISKMESDLIEALRSRYAGAAHFEVDYKVAMAKVANSYPKDPDVLTLYAESIMDLRPWGLYDRAGRPAIETQLIVHLLRRAINAKSDHIGANHFLIHAVEGEELRPTEALAAAEVLHTRVPDAGHLQHMPSHIYMRLGRYHDAVESNRLAVAADERMYGKACPGQDCLQLYYGHYLSHNLSFLTAAATMEGDSETAIDAASRTSNHAARFVHGERGLEHYLAVYWITLVNFREWDRILQEAPRAIHKGCPEGCPEEGCHLLNAMLAWSQGMALAATGKPDAAEKALEKFDKDRFGIFRLSWGNNTPESVLKIARTVLLARIATARRQLDAAIEALSVAVSLEDDLIYDEPPTWLYSARQAWGGALLAAGRKERDIDAVAVFREDLAANRNPKNGRSLFGLATALKRLNKPEWHKRWQEYKKAWHGRELQPGDLW